MLWRNESGKKIRHYKKGDTSACGSLNNIGRVKDREHYMTDKFQNVTCGRCMRTKIYQNAVGQYWDNLNASIDSQLYGPPLCK